MMLSEKEVNQLKCNLIIGIYSILLEKQVITQREYEALVKQNG